MHKNLKKICLIALGALFITTTIHTSAKTKLNKTSLTLEEGEAATLKVTGSKKTIKWSSSDKKIATVTNKGKVTAKKAGNCKIIAKSGSKRYICKLKVIKKDNKPVTDTTEKDTADTEKIIIKELIIKENNKEIYGKIYYPEKEGKYPAVILSHGYNGTNSDFVQECTYFAQNGYVAYAYDFCGGSSRSKSSGKSTDMTIFTEKEDLLAVFNYIQALNNVDPDQMFLFGGSQGGFVTTLAAEELMDKVKSVILYFPALNIPDDWRRNYPTIDKIPEVTDFWGLKLGKEFFLSIHDFYTFDNIGSYPNDVLIIYGDKDNIVPYNAMIEAQKTYNHAELVVLKNEGHGFSSQGGKKAREMVLDFLKKH